MEKDSVIAIRDALLQDGKNRTVRIVFDNGINISASSDIILWDDDKELVLALTADYDSGAFEVQMPVKIIGSTYENIQFITANTNVENLNSVLDEIGKITTISADDKKKIVHWYDSLYDYRKNLSKTNYNPIDLKRGEK